MPDWPTMRELAKKINAFHRMTRISELQVISVTVSNVRECDYIYITLSRLLILLKM